MNIKDSKIGRHKKKKYLAEKIKKHMCLRGLTKEMEMTLPDAGTLQKEAIYNAQKEEGYIKRQKLRIQKIKTSEDILKRLMTQAKFSNKK